MIAKAKRRAKLNNIDFDIKDTDIIIPKKCPILNVNFKIGTKGDYKYSPSLDRIDNLKGYTKDNIQIISSLANTMKNCASKSELITFSKYMIKYYSDDIVRPIGK